MISLFVFIGFTVVAGVCALYSFLERDSWMLSQIAASLVSSIILWVETMLFASGNVGIMENVLAATHATGSEVLTDTTYTYTAIWTTVTDPSLTFLMILFAAVMTIYTILHVFTWVQERALGYEEEEDYD